MDPDSCSQLIILVLLLLLAVFWTVTATAMLSLNKYRLRNLVTELDPRALLLHRIMQDSVKLNDTLSIGDSVLKVSATVLGTVLAFRNFGDDKNLLAVIIIFAVGMVVIGEILPKTIVQKNPERILLKLARVIPVMTLVLFPVVKVFKIFGLFFEKLLGVNSCEDNTVTEEEIIQLVAAGKENGVIHQEEKTMIHGVFEFTETLARDLMVPRPDIVAVEKDTKLHELLDVIRKEQFSRIPVYDKSIDNILGVVHIKDLVMAKARETDNFILSDYLRPALFIPETKKINDLLRTMKKEKIHLCIVLDEYGGTAGLVTMEDIIEEIMGDIQDEHDIEEPDYHQIDEKVFDVKASLRIEELREKLGINLECSVADTVGGLVFTQLGRIPVVGDSVTLPDVELAVVLMDGHRIEKVRLTKLEHEEGTED